MKKLLDIDDDTDLESGTVLRLYGVHRRDVMKLVEDRQNPRKKAKDYYDFLLFDGSVITCNPENNDKNIFVLVNATSNSSHRGDILAIIETETRYALKAAAVKKYFNGPEEVYVVKGTAAK